MQILPLMMMYHHLRALAYSLRYRRETKGPLQFCNATVVISGRLVNSQITGPTCVNTRKLTPRLLSSVKNATKSSRGETTRQLISKEHIVLQEDQWLNAQHFPVMARKGRYRQRREFKRVGKRCNREKDRNRFGLKGRYLGLCIAFYE